MNRRMWNAILGITLASCLLPDLSAAESTTSNTSANAGDWGTFDVGSGIIHLELKGDCNASPCAPGAGVRRPVDVLLWYPADKKSYAAGSPTIYGLRLNGVTLDPTKWDPASWTVIAERARDGVAVDQDGPSFPFIIASHGGPGDPQNSAPTLERLASHGFIVAAPFHNGGTLDDQFTDMINLRAAKKIVPCLDGGPSPCLDAIQKEVQNRALDVTALLDTIGSYFGDRVDTERVGVLGQSRGSALALAVAGGNTTWHIAPEPRVDAIMLMASANRAAMLLQNLGNITVPALIVNSKADRMNPMSISIDVFNAIASEEKGLVILERGEHGVYSSQRCSNMQVAGAIYQANARAIIEQFTMENIMLAATSGTPIDYCTYGYFVNPVDVTPLVKTITGFTVTPENVPKMLDTDNAMRLIVELASTYFDATLVKKGQPGVHFKQYISPKFLMKKEGDIVSYSESESFQGRAAECDDLGLASLDPSCAD